MEGEISFALGNKTATSGYVCGKMYKYISLQFLMIYYKKFISRLLFLENDINANCDDLFNAYFGNRRLLQKIEITTFLIAKSAEVYSTT